MSVTNKHITKDKLLKISFTVQFSFNFLLFKYDTYSVLANVIQAKAYQWTNDKETVNLIQIHVE